MPACQEQLKGHSPRATACCRRLPLHLNDRFRGRECKSVFNVLHVCISILRFGKVYSPPPPPPPPHAGCSLAILVLSSGSLHVRGELRVVHGKVCCGHDALVARCLPGCPHRSPSPCSWCDQNGLSFCRECFCKWHPVSDDHP